MKDLIEVLTSRKNQVFSPHTSIVAYNLNSNSCCILFNRAVMDVKLKFNIVL